MKVPENFKPKNQTFTEDYQIKSQIKKVERIKKKLCAAGRQKKEVLILPCSLKCGVTDITFLGVCR